MFIDKLKEANNKTYTENGAVTYGTTLSDCLDLFATIGALRNADEEEIIKRFMRAYAEDADMAMKTLFFARDIRGGLGERRVFRAILAWLAVNEAKSVRRNLEFIAEYGRFDDLLALIGTPCEKDMLDLVKAQLNKDIESMEAGKEVSLIAKWLPSVNASNKETVKIAKKVAKDMGMSDAEYRKNLSALRAYIKIIENNLREKDYSFDYEKQPSKALYKYRQAFCRNDADRYQAFLNKAEVEPSVMHTGTLTPYDVIAPIVKRVENREKIGEDERKAMDVTWNSLEDFVGAENALAVIDGSGSMYWGGMRYMPAAVAQSLGIYFAEHNKGAFYNHFITFSANPRLVEIKGGDIVDKVKYCMSYNECANTNIERTFQLILQTAVENEMSQEDIPEKLYIISDMEFDSCADGSKMTNFEHAKSEFEKHGFKLPQIVFWNVASRNEQQPVTKNEQGVALVSGCSPQIFSMLSKDILNPMDFMLEVLNSRRYEQIAA